ncbi:MAG: hypothetical protein NTZ90_01920 [Proteobacteria bacterium]|nr:hypothetical protein [Pseudomonadota bacterium]
MSQQLKPTTMYQKPNYHLKKKIGLPVIAAALSFATGCGAAGLLGDSNKKKADVAASALSYQNGSGSGSATADPSAKPTATAVAPSENKVEADPKANAAAATPSTPATTNAALQKCLANWPNHPFTVEQTAKPIILYQGTGNILGYDWYDFKDSIAPKLFFIPMTSTDQQNFELSLTNPHGWYCIDAQPAVSQGRVEVERRIVISLGCSSTLNIQGLGDVSWATGERHCGVQLPIISATLKANGAIDVREGRKSDWPSPSTIDMTNK